MVDLCDFVYVNTCAFGGAVRIYGEVYRIRVARFQVLAAVLLKT